MQKYFNNVTNRTGDVVPGAIVTVTLSATGALATIYSDNGVTTRANPITCDNNGYFEFYAADGNYTLTINGSGIQAQTISDVLIEDVSDLTGGEGASLVGYLPAGTGAVATTVKAALDEVVSVKRFGAVGDGVTDDTAAIQAAITASYGKRLPIPDGTYRLTSGLTVTDAIHLDLAPGAVLDYSGVAAGTGLGGRIAVTFSGTAPASDITVTTNIAARATTIQISSTAGLSVDDWIVVRSDDPYITGGDPLDHTLGHITRVRSVDSATQITVWEPSPFAYTAASNARVAKFTPLLGAKITGGKVLCGGAGKVHSGVRFNWSDSPMCEGVQIDGAEDTGVSFANCISPQAIGNAINKSTSPGGAIGNTGYGIAIYGGKGGRAAGNRVFNCRHAVAGGAGDDILSIGFEFIGNDVFACGNASANTWALDCHEPCYHWKFIGNTVIGCYGGAVLRGPGTVFVGNTIRDTVVGGVHVQQFENNTVGLPRITVKDNVIENTGGSAIRALGHNTTASDKILQLIVAGNQISGSAEHPILLDYTYGAMLSDNVVANTGGSGRHAIYVRNSERVSVNGGQLDCSLSTNGSALYIENSDRITASGVHMTGSNAAVNQDGVRSAGSGSNDTIIIDGCYISGFSRYGIYTTNSDRVIVTSNDVRDVVSATKILISAAVTSVNANNIT